MPPTIALFLAFAAVTASPAETLDALLERNRDAVGLERCSCEAIDIRLEISEPEFTVDGHYRATRDGWVRMDIYAGNNRVFTEALGPDGAWQWRPGKGVSEVSEQGQAALRHGVVLPGKFFALADMPARGHVLEDLGPTEIDDKLFRGVKLTLADGFERAYYLDPESAQVTYTRDRRALHPDVDPTPVTIQTRRSDFRRVDGVLRAFREESFNLETGEKLSTVRVRSIATPPRLPGSIFRAGDAERP